MSQQIAPFTISAPGFYGLNLQDSPVDMNPAFALIAENCVIDKSGRIAARKGWEKKHTSNTELSTSNVTCIGELIENDGTATTLAAGGGYLFKHSGTTLTTLTYGGGGAAPTISANNWQFCQLSGVGIFWQRGYDPLIYDPAVSTTTFRRLSEKSGYTGSVQTANTAISAYGRIWNADTSTAKNTVQWSDLLQPHVYTGGTSGTLNLIGVWPLGGDEIVALAAHNNFLIIFGKKQTLIYSGANDPSTMVLADSLSIGCIARDSVQNTGEDVIFLANDGVRSLMRTIQEKSAPLRGISSNVRDNLQEYVSSDNTDNIKSAYCPVDAFYLLTCPASTRTYCFDLRAPLENGANRVTIWTVAPTAFCFMRSRKLYIGKAGYIGEYTSYLDDASEYRMKYYTTWIDFGNPIQITILKKVLLTLIGTDAQTVVLKYAFDFLESYRSQSATITSSGASSEYGIAEYGIAEYGGSALSNIMNINIGGTGRVVQLGMEAQINSKQLSIQKIDVFTKQGRL